MTLQVESPTVYTCQGVPISVTGIAQVSNFYNITHHTAIYNWTQESHNQSHLLFQVKIQGQNEEMLSTACEQFLGKTESEIHDIALVTLEGHQRAIMGSMTVEVTPFDKCFYT